MLKLFTRKYQFFISTTLSYKDHLRFFFKHPKQRTFLVRDMSYMQNFRLFNFLMVEIRIFFYF